jgi:hypothetical protein
MTGPTLFTPKWAPRWSYQLSVVQVYTTTDCRFYREQHWAPHLLKAGPDLWPLYSQQHFSSIYISQRDWQNIVSLSRKTGNIAFKSSRVLSQTKHEREYIDTLYGWVMVMGLWTQILIRNKINGSISTCVSSIFKDPNVHVFPSSKLQTRHLTLGKIYGRHHDVVNCYGMSVSHI